MAQLANGNIAILYETSPTSSGTDGLKAMYYRELTLKDMLG